MDFYSMFVTTAYKYDPLHKQVHKNVLVCSKLVSPTMNHHLNVKSSCNIGLCFLVNHRTYMFVWAIGITRSKNSTLLIKSLCLCTDSKFHDNLVLFWYLLVKLESTHIFCEVIITTNKRWSSIISWQVIVH